MYLILKREDSAKIQAALGLLGGLLSKLAGVRKTRYHVEMPPAYI